MSIGVGLLLNWMRVDSIKGDTLAHKVKINNLAYDDFNDRNLANDASSSIIKPIFIRKDDQNDKRINGLWLLVKAYAVTFGQNSAGKRELPLVGENYFYIKLWKRSIVRMTRMSEDVEGEEEYYISALSDKKISVFQRVSNNTIQRYHLQLVELDAGNSAEESHSKEIGMSNEVILKLNEAYDRKLQKIINQGHSEYEIEGFIELTGKSEITNIFARINGFELNPTNLKKELEGTYVYETEDDNGGKAQASFISQNEFNLYFVSGPYRGYTLIFSRELSDDEQHKRESSQMELKDRQLSRGNNQFNALENEGHILTEEEAIQAQEDAVAQRKELVMNSSNGQRRGPVSYSSSQDDGKYRETVNVLLRSGQDGRPLSRAEQALLDKHSQQIRDQGGLNFSNPIEQQSYQYEARSLPIQLPYSF